MSTTNANKWSLKTTFQILLPLFFVAGLFNQGVTYESLQATTSRWPEVCLFHRWTGFLCPGCGMTRSMISFFSYNLGLSFQYHPLGPVLGFSLISFWIVSFWPKRWDKSLELLARVTKRYALVGIILLVVWNLLRQ